MVQAPNLLCFLRHKIQHLSMWKRFRIVTQNPTLEPDQRDKIHKLSEYFLDNTNVETGPLVQDSGQ